MLSQLKPSLKNDHIRFTSIQSKTLMTDPCQEFTKTALKPIKIGCVVGWSQSYEQQDTAVKIHHKRRGEKFELHKKKTVFTLVQTLVEPHKYGQTLVNVPNGYQL